MAFKSIAPPPNPLSHFSSTGMVPIGTSGVYLKIRGQAHPLANFAQTSVQPINSSGRYKPVSPLPGTGSTHTGGQFGFSF